MKLFILLLLQYSLSSLATDDFKRPIPIEDFNTSTSLATDEFYHPISIEDYNTLKWVSQPISEPVSFSSRVRRQLTDGTLSYVYDTDTDESTGEWGPWEQGGQGCSRTCGGGVMIGKCPTLWKFHDFSITQHLREINFGDF